MHGRVLRPSLLLLIAPCSIAQPSRAGKGHAAVQPRVEDELTQCSPAPTLAEQHSLPPEDHKVAMFTVPAEVSDRRGEQVLRVRSSAGSSIEGEVYIRGSNTTNYYIPDRSVTMSSIVISGAPSYATVTRVKCIVQVNHSHLSDLVLTIIDTVGRGVRIWNRGGGWNDGGYDDTDHLF